MHRRRADELVRNHSLSAFLNGTRGNDICLKNTVCGNRVAHLECASNPALNIEEAIKHLDDEEIVELSNRVVVKLDDMTDEKFAEMEFISTE